LLENAAAAPSRRARTGKPSADPSFPFSHQQTMRPTFPSNAPTLMLWPSVPAWRIAGQLWLDRKWKDGTDAWCAAWPGPVRVLMDVIDIDEQPSFGAYRWEDSESLFELRTLAAGETYATTDLAGIDLLLASADEPRHLVAPHRCAGTKTACMLVIEYTLRTRIALTLWATGSRYKKAKVLVWQWFNERRVVRAMRESRGVQANGIPAFRVYERASPSTQLYFDTRLTLAAVIAAAPLEARLGGLRQGKPLRLAFSGRFIAGKGADALVPLALMLRKRGIAFTLDLFGSGELEDAMRADIAANALQDTVRLHGPVDFDSELVPRLKDSVDLFVCCHRQGDPSCTYAETLGCGVPIVGFANEALASMVQEHDIGWTVPLGDTAALARLVAKLAGDREQIVDKSRKAMRFGRQHHFESTFALRAQHCASVLNARTVPLPSNKQATT
jgi:colanic acid/amylovoran biosynthesis glycosyltransferase